LGRRHQERQDWSQRKREKVNRQHPQCSRRVEGKHAPPPPPQHPLTYLFIQPQEYNRVYTFEELKKIPKGLDKTKLEQYLSDEDFMKHFRMTKEEFYDLPAWQQMNKRQEAGLK